MPQNRVSRRAALAMATASGLMAVSHTFAQVTSSPAVIWDGNGTPGATGSYVNALNWNPDTLPSNVANNFLEINDGGTAQVAVGDAAQGTFLNLGLNTGDTGHLEVHGGSLTLGELRVGGRETLQSNLNDYTTGTFNPIAGGAGTVVQDGGDVFITYRDASNTEPPVQSLYVGDGGLASGNTANGSYTISGGTLTSGVANDDAIVVGTGAGTIGTFIQSGNSVVTSTGSVTVARAGATGSYSISGGALNVGTLSNSLNFLIGNGSSVDGTTSVAGTNGTFTQTAGNITVQSGFMTVGSAGGTGSYSMSAGTLNVGVGTTTTNMSMFIGDGANAAGTAAVSGTTGSFTQTGGDIVVKSGFEVGRRAGTGTYTMSAGTLGVGAELRIGSNANSGVAAFQNSTGTFTLSGTGAVTVGTNLHVGISSSSVANTTQGTLNMSGGSISFPLAGAIMAVGNGLGTNGTASISGGTLTMNGATALLDIGRNNASGLFDVSGTANVSVSKLTLETASPAGTVTRELRLRGGTLNVGLWAMGTTQSAANITRVVNVSGGILNVGSATAPVAGAGVTYNFSGGTSTFSGVMALNTSPLNVSNTAALTFTNLHTQNAAVSISGGTVTAASVNEAGSESGSMTISGGALNVAGAYVITSNNGFTTPGSLTVNGGSLSTATLVTSALTSPPTGTVLTLSSGSIAATTSTTITSTSTFNLSGGSFSSPTVTESGAFNYSGGSLTAATIFTLSSNATMKTDNNLSLTGVSNFNVGNATLNVNSGSLTIPNLFNDNSRTLTKTGPGILNINGAQANAGTAAITVSAGTLNLNSNAAGAAVGVAGALTVNANSTTNFSVSQGLANITVGSGAVATLTENATPTTTSKVINTTAVGAIAGKLDLTNNKLVTTSAIGTLSGTIYSGILGLVQTGRNGGAWTGTGIVTSETQAAAGSITTLGVATAGQAKGVAATATTTWAGQTVTGSDSLVMYTYGGDANLDGKINVDDYTRIDFNVPLGVGGWYNGDFNYDGKINVDDYTIIDFNVGIQGTPFATGAGSDLSGVTAVPEPTSLTMVGLVGLGALRRRRRR